MKFLQWNYLLLFLLATFACVEPYDPPVNDADVNFLVVEGFINASNGIATVTLTRTLPVENSGVAPSESGAFISIEDDKGLAFQLSESGNGFYTGSIFNVSFDNQYRLSIQTRDQAEYNSEFISLKETPAIDSINYSILENGIEFAVSTHDEAAASDHFRWKYSETYEYNSEFASIVQFIGDEVLYRPGDQSIYRCWKTNESTNIMIGSTGHLKESVVSNFPIIFVPGGSIKLSRKYSLLIQQQALTEEAYNFWLNLQKSTEGLGGLFDPLPSEVTGNIHNTTDPAKKVIGFFSGCSVTESRIFVVPGELPREMNFSRGNANCIADTILMADLPQVPRTQLLIDAVYGLGGSLIGYTTSDASCIDCRYRGGIVAKPDYWD